MILRDAERTHPHRVELTRLDDGVVGGDLRNKNLRKHQDFLQKCQCHLPGQGSQKEK